MIAWSRPNAGPRQLHLVLPPGVVAQNATAQFGGMGGMGGGMGGVAGKAIHRTSDATGIADFGAVPPGDYEFQISKSWANGCLQNWRPAQRRSRKQNSQGDYLSQDTSGTDARARALVVAG